MNLHESVLRDLPLGGVIWMPASGQSLWPFVLDGDVLRVERATEAQLQLGEVAVVKLASGVLIAHLVETVAPLQTASSVGVIDSLPLEALGRVTALRRNGVVVPLVPVTRSVLRWVPTTARWLRRFPAARSVVRALRGKR